jgi:ankyrin repeat protein
LKGISRIADNDGWTSLHFAAYFHCYSVIEMLLDKDRDVAYMKDKEGRTALHIAAQCNNGDIVSLIVSRCPDCCELVDNRGWNVLHFAFKGKNYLESTIKIIIENSSLDNLLNEKNADGDTPLHFYSNSLSPAKDFVAHSRVDKKAFNKKNLSAWDIAKANSGIFSEVKVTHNFILHLKNNISIVIYLSVFQCIFKSCITQVHHSVIRLYIYNYHLLAN